jgi:hypothetical protein
MSAVEAVTTSEPFSVRISLLDDGSIANPRFEQYALLCADGIDDLKAWRLLSPPKAKKAGRDDYQLRVNRNHTFKRRLKTLIEQKEELQAKGVWGRAEWQLEQLYRTARATNDSTLMAKATEMLIKVAEKISPPAAPVEDQKEAGKGRGAPVAENPQTKKVDPAAIKAKLMRMDRPEDIEDEAVVDEA